MAKKPLRSIAAPKNINFDLKGVNKSSIEDGSTGEDPGVDYMPKDEMGQKFVAAHKTEKHADRNGNTTVPYTGNPEHYTLNSKKEKRHGNMQGAAQKVYEEADQIDELSKETLQSYLDKQRYSKDKSPTQSYNRLVGSARAARKMAAEGMKCEACSKEECECGPNKKKLLLGSKKGLAEVLTKNTPTKDVIHDFVHSDAPNFKNKSKEERIKMALGAKYSMMRKEDLAMPMLEGGKKKNKKTTQLEKESSDVPMSFPSGNVGDGVAQGRV